jgi:serine kinase of HPr protein (carbohydrate metabolism regulator)
VAPDALCAAGHPASGAVLTREVRKGDASVPLRIGELMDAAGLELLCGPSPADLDTPVLSPHLHRLDSLQGPRLQVPPRNLVFALSPDEVREVCDSSQLRERLRSHVPSAVVTFGGVAERDDLRRRCAVSGLVLLGAAHTRAAVEASLEHLLFSRVEGQVSLHGVMVLIWGLGVLILGASGSGKTDAALEFIRKGHALVADDAVALFCPQLGTVWGKALGVGPHRMAVYGLGLIEVASVFGAKAVAAAGPIRLVVDLQEHAAAGYENPLEAKGEVLHLMGVPVPYLALAQIRRPNLVTLVELAVKLLQKGKEPWVTVTERVR